VTAAEKSTNRSKVPENIWMKLSRAALFRRHAVSGGCFGSFVFLCTGCYLFKIRAGVSGPRSGTPMLAERLQFPHRVDVRRSIMRAFAREYAIFDQFMDIVTFTHKCSDSKHRFLTSSTTMEPRENSRIRYFWIMIEIACSTLLP